MNIKIESIITNDNVAVIEVSGEIDVYTSPKISQSIQNIFDQGIYRFKFDFSQVRYIDSTGLFQLTNLLEKVREMGIGNIAILNTQEPLQKIFKITGLDRLFKIFSDKTQFDQFDQFMN